MDYLWSTPRLITVELPLLIHPVVNIDILLANGIPRRPLSPADEKLAVIIMQSNGSTTVIEPVKLAVGGQLERRSQALEAGVQTPMPPSSGQLLNLRLWCNRTSQAQLIIS